VNDDELREFIRAQLRSSDLAILVRQLQTARGAWQPGMLTPYGGTAAPDGWLLCDGSTVAQADYPDLFAVVGTWFNTGGEAASDFRLPDMRGRVPLGVGTAVGAPGASAHTLGQKGGEETHTLSAAEMPMHTHPSPGSRQFVTAFGAATATWPAGSGGGAVQFDTATGSAGGNAAHNTLPPYVGLNWLIKT
jgi:microcystin-dependent protein